MTNKFQINYLAEKYDIDLVESEPSQNRLSLDILDGYRFDSINDYDKILNIIFQYIRSGEIHPNDVCIISTNIPLLRKLDQKIRLEMNEKTQTTFESEEVYMELEDRYRNNKDMLSRELESIRGSKKFSFNLNSGLIKISTVHSFKGLESSTAAYLLMKEDSEEMVYTGITRAKHNFISFLQDGNGYMDFFNAEVGIK